MSSPAVVDIGDQIPDFVLDSQVGMISYHGLVEAKWGLILTFDKAYDPVATTDIGMLCKLYEEFDSRNVTIVVIGSDSGVTIMYHKCQLICSVNNYRRWQRDIEELQEVKVGFPMCSDQDFALGCAREATDENEVSGFRCFCSGAFLIDAAKTLRCSFKYSLSTGRNIYELIRLYDALQVVTYHSVVCPSNWGAGQDVMVNNAVTNEEAQKRLPKGFAEIKPWFRLTPCPENN